MKCSHETARLEESRCGYITLLCDCSTPLAEMRDHCKCSPVPWGNYLTWDDDFTEDKAWELYALLGGKKERVIA